jgi:Flp pilus assembly protein TadD
VLLKACELGNIQSFNELGIIYKQEGNFEEAKKVLQKACELGNIQSFNELGIIYKQEGNFEEAKKVLLKACELGNIQSFNELGIIYKEEGNFEEAKKVLGKALAIKDNDVKALNELAIVYKEEGNFEEAKKVLLKALAIKDNDVKALNELAIVYKEEGNFAKAIETVEKGLKIEPNNKYLPNAKRSIYQAQKAHKSMQPSIQQAIAALQNANYAGYFEEMDKIVPVSLQNPYQEHKGKFIAGNYPYNFYQQLEVFAREVDKELNKKLPEGNFPKNILHTDNKERVEAIRKQLLMTNKLKSEWEEKEILENNPNEKMKCELEIKKLNVKIAALKEELARLA